MIEETLFSLDMPYRDSLEVKALSFGVDVAGAVLGEGADAQALSPSVCLVAGIRGDEVHQTLICSLLAHKLAGLEQERSLAPGKRITVIPCANSSSMGIGRRFWPGDNTDVNRMFPGYNAGETTQRIAAGIFDQVRGYRYGIHFSSFYLCGDFVPHVRIMHGPGETANHGCDFGLPFVVHHVPGSFDTTTLHYNWRLWDTEAYTFYTDKTDLADLEAAHDAVRSVLRFLSARGIVRKATFGGKHATQLSEHALVPVFASSGGIFCPVVKPGEIVDAGQTLATVISTRYGTMRATLVAPCEGMVFYVARTPLANRQTLAFQIVPPDAARESTERGNFLDPEA